MNRIQLLLAISSVLLPGLSINGGSVRAQDAAPDRTHEIFGIVQELRSGTPDVSVCLCDGETGLPVDRATYKPFQWENRQAKGWNEALAITTTDSRGRFRFPEVPDGNYRVVALRWAGPTKDFFEMESSVLQLMGAVDNVRVPRSSEYYEAMVAVLPAGRGIVEFDQKVPNSDTILFLSTAPPEFDPILGLHAMGPAFLKNLIGINRMPLGKTTLLGAPPTPIYAFFFAPDNSPGFATVNVDPSPIGLVRVPSTAFVAGWSDGRKTPPESIANLIELIVEHSVSINDLLKIPALSAATHQEYKQRLTSLYAELSDEIEVAPGHKARIGDLLAAKGYMEFAK